MNSWFIFRTEVLPQQTCLKFGMVRNGSSHDDSAS
jgi:hypothetical protein